MLAVPVSISAWLLLPSLFVVVSFLSLRLYYLRGCREMKRLEAIGEDCTLRLVRQFHYCSNSIPRTHSFSPCPHNIRVLIQQVFIEYPVLQYLTITHYLSHTPSHSHTHTLPLSHTSSHSHTHTHTSSHSHTHPPTLTHPPTHTHPPTLTHILPFSPSP